MSLVEQSDWGKCKAACSTPAVLKPCRCHPHLPLPISPSPSPHWAERRKKRGGNRATKGGNPATTHLCSGGQKQGTLVTVPSTICWLYCPCMHVCMHTHTHTHTRTHAHTEISQEFGSPSQPDHTLHNCLQPFSYCCDRSCCPLLITNKEIKIIGL